MTEIWQLLPDDFPYVDRGCELYPSCLKCPFPDCIREEPWGKERYLKTRRAERMLAMKKEGKTDAEVAAAFGVSKRTVQRALKMLEDSH